MRKRLVQYIFLLCINLLPSILFAEAGDTLTSTIDRLNTYQHQNYLEEIYVKPDKNFYVSGEFLRFSIFCFESRTRQPSSLSKVAYLELLDTDQKSVIQTKIFLDNGKGYGEVFIPSNFESGNYLLRCYTRWMKNYRADLYFQSIVQIINPFKKPGLSPNLFEILEVYKGGPM